MNFSLSTQKKRERSAMVFRLLLVLTVCCRDAVYSFMLGPSSEGMSTGTFGRTLGGITNPASRNSVSYTSSRTQLEAYQKIFVAGGSKGVGRCIIDQLVSQGRQVVALVRKEEDAALLQGLGIQSMEVSNHDDGASSSASLVTAIVGDAFDQKTVENAMDGCDAAITTLGGSVSDTSRRIDYDGNNNVIESAGILGVTRVILVTSIGCGSSRAAAPPSTLEVLKDVLAAKEKAENVLIKYYTNTNWTIIRPGGLKSEPATGRAILTEDTAAIGAIHREDVAALVLQALDSAKTERKILSAIDPSVTSAVAPEGQVVQTFAL